MTSLSFDARVGASFDDTIERVTAALKEEGFGVLTRIDVHEAFQEKLGKDFRPYAILGACNPQLAHAALSEHPEVGLLLPCNVTVEEDPAGGCLVRIIDPKAMMRPLGKEMEQALADVAGEAEQRLRRLADALQGGSG